MYNALLFKISPSQCVSESAGFAKRELTQTQASAKIGNVESMETKKILKYSDAPIELHGSRNVAALTAPVRCSHID